MTKKKARPATRTKKAVRKKTAQKPVSKATHLAASDVLRRHAERLRQSGAHAMRIAPGAKGPVIEVYVPEDFTGTLPLKVGASIKGKPVDIPVKMRKAPRFTAE